MNFYLFIADHFANERAGFFELVTEELINVLTQNGNVVNRINSNQVKVGVLEQVQSYDPKFVVCSFNNLGEEEKRYLEKNCNYVIVESQNNFLRSKNPASFNEFKAPESELTNKSFYSNAAAVFCQNQFQKIIVERNLGIQNVVNVSNNASTINSFNVLQNVFSAAKSKQEAQLVPVEQLPKISLITSVFKAKEYIDQLMEDVTRQTIFKDKCEWVILNANPQEETYEEEVIKKYIEKFPENIKYKRLETDPGIYAVWNEAVKMSTGEFLTNINCDDRRSPDNLHKQASLLFSKNEASLVYNDSYIVHEPNVLWENVDKTNTQKYNFEKFSPEAMLRGNLPHNNPMWKKELHQKHGYFEEKYRSAGDWEFWLRCAFAGEKFEKHDEVLGVYYFNPKGISTNQENSSWKRQEEKEVFKKYLSIYEKRKNY